MWESLQIYTFLVSQTEFFIMSKNKTFGVADITVGTIGCPRSIYKYFFKCNFLVNDSHIKSFRNFYNAFIIYLDYYYKAIN